MKRPLGVNLINLQTTQDKNIEMGSIYRDQNVTQICLFWGAQQEAISQGNKNYSVMSLFSSRLLTMNPALIPIRQRYRCYLGKSYLTNTYGADKWHKVDLM